MKTRVIQVDSLEPDPDAIQVAAGMLRSGKLVAFPTETVYGLGANALDAHAVERIFEAKGRPPTNPVIVHVADLAQVRGIVAEWPAAADRLAAHFWPGPLSLVLPKQPNVPDVVTAGGSTVAVRRPAHPVAERLLKEAGLPIAAPSANSSMRISPTSAEHVLATLDGRIDLLLDGGPAPRGLESTVLDLTVDPPQLLRPGLIGRTELSQVLELEVGLPTTLQGRESDPSAVEPARSPGQMERHYAPLAPVECLSAGAGQRVRQLLAAGERVGWLCWQTDTTLPRERVEQIRMPQHPDEYATSLYAALYRLEAAAVDRIVIELPPRDEAWLAVQDRLRRASTPLP